MGGTPFNGFTHMELTALRSELATLTPDKLNLFLEPRESMVRMFHAPPAKWARGGESLTANFTNIQRGEFFTFQIGLFANGVAAQDIRVTFLGAKPLSSSSSAIPAGAFRCFNTGGTDPHGVPFTKQFSLAANDTGSLWIGVDLPASAVGSYEATFTVAANKSAARDDAHSLFISLFVLCAPLSCALCDSYAFVVCGG